MSKPEVKSENKCAHTQDQECIVLAAEMIIKIHRGWGPATTKGNPTPPLNAADGQTPDNEGTVFNPSKETNKLKGAITIFDKTVVEPVGITRTVPSNQKKVHQKMIANTGGACTNIGREENAGVGSVVLRCGDNEPRN